MALFRHLEALQDRKRKVREGHVYVVVFRKEVWSAAFTGTVAAALLTKKAKTSHHGSLVGVAFPPSFMTLLRYVNPTICPCLGPFARRNFIL